MATSLAVIVAMTRVSASVRRSNLVGRPRQCQKMTRKDVVTWRNSKQNVATNGHCGNAGACGGSGLIAGCEVVIVVLVRWLEVDWKLAGGCPK